MAEQLDKVRVDRWLWATRIFKTRPLAVEGCRSGHVKIEGDSVKPSRMLRVGEELVVTKGEITRTLRVTALLSKRVGAKLVMDYLEDLTPPGEYEMQRLTVAQKVLKRDRGAGRPTKKDRRDLAKFFDM